MAVPGAATAHVPGPSRVCVPSLMGTQFLVPRAAISARLCHHLVRARGSNTQGMPVGVMS